MNSNPEEIGKLLKLLDGNSKALIKEIYEICWYMRGSISRDDAWSLSREEREVIVKIIKQNIENTQKTMMPLI